MSRLAKLLTSVITILCLVAVAVVLWIQTQNKDDTYEVTAYFEKGIGLYENGDVTVLGVPVGKITEVEPMGSKVRVEMVIPAEEKIPADTSAQIVPISVISDRYVELQHYESGPTLEDGATIPIERTIIPAELDDVFKQLKKLLDALRPDGSGELGSLGELIVALNKALEGREQDLRGTLIQGAKLTQTLAGARDDISGLLINLDQLFGKLAPRAGSIATLNRNFATVMRFLADSRADLEGTLVNLSAAINDLADFAKDNSSRVASLLTKAARITPIVLKNKQSILQSLAWLGVVGEGLRNAYHGGEINATDVRSNANARICEDFDDLPIDPGAFPPPLDQLFQDILDQLEDEICPSPDGGGGPAPAPAPGGPAAAPVPKTMVPDLQINCRKQVRKVKRQIERIEEFGVPEEVKGEVLRPLQENMDELSKECRKIDGVLENPEALQELIDDLPQELLDTLEVPRPKTPKKEDLTGSASGSAPAPAGDQDDEDSWIDSFLDFVGVG